MRQRGRTWLYSTAFCLVTCAHTARIVEKREDNIKEKNIPELTGVLCWQLCLQALADERIQSYITHNGEFWVVCT